MHNLAYFPALSTKNNRPHFLQFKTFNKRGNIAPLMGRDYQREMDLFYSRIGQFIQERPGLISELEEKLGFFAPLQMPDKDKRMLVLDWFVFDGKSKTFKKNLLDFFLTETE